MLANPETCAVRVNGDRSFGAVLCLGGLLLGCLALEACGSSPTTPSGAKPGGTIAGRYSLELTPAPSCGGYPVTIDVEVTETGDYPHPGVQLLDRGTDAGELDLGTDAGELELELEYVDNVLTGGFGTRASVGVKSDQGPQVWVTAIGEGATVQTSDGRGEVLAGVLRGDLEIEEVTGVCTAVDHSFRLRAR